MAVPISQAAIQADPTLANYQTYDLQVTLAPGERWLSAEMDAELTSGSFYNVPTNKSGANFAQSNLWSIVPQLQADTVVSSSNFGQPIILGQFNPNKSNGGTFSTTSTNVSWGSVSDTGTGTLRLPA